jgi:lysophospholipase L1-like esterase
VIRVERTTKARKMKGLLFRSLLGVAVVASALAPLDSAAADTKPSYYLALGDSLSIGVQPIATSPDGATEEGYADQLAAALRVENPALRLVKLGCGGESTGTMLGVVEPTPTGEGCNPNHFKYPHGTQLADAVSFLHAHRNQTALVTIDIGVNDTFCLLALDRECFDAGMASIRENLTSILAALRAAAGPGVPIVAMNSYGPAALVWFDDPGYAMAVNELFLEFNATLEAVYAQAGVPVADVEAAFATADFSPDPDTGLPVNVARACAWTWMCEPPPLGPDTHANREGYGVIARAFENALEATH